jgi:hypothetical protein
VYTFPGGDKAGHFILLGILSFLATRLALARNPTGSWRLAVLTGLVVAVLAAAEEYTQQIFLYRNASWTYLASSLAGITVFGMIGWLSMRGDRRYTRARN